MFDIIIVGGGIAGMTAGLYARRSGKKVLILEKESIGGQIASSPVVENYPTQSSISGMELCDKIFEQCQSLGVEFDFEEVLKIEDGKIKKIVCENQTFQTKAIILATGSKHRTLGLEKEEEFTGNGIGYCVVCDGEFYAGKSVGVVGGGNSALTNALYLANICPKVTIFQELGFLTGENQLVEKVSKNPKIEIKLNSKITKLLGKDELSGVAYLQNNQEKTQNIDSLFVSIGQKSQNENFKNLISVDNFGYFSSDENCSTNLDGIFVAGDCRHKKIRQLTTASADGSVASIMACSYIDKLD